MLSHPLMPPASPGDAQRPATAADIAANPLVRAAWLDYANDLQRRAAQQSHRAAMQQLVGETPTVVTARETTKAAPLFTIVWEQRGPRDARPTFADAIDAYCAKHGTTIAQLGKQHNMDSSLAYRVRLCNAIAGTYTRNRWAGIIHMRPNSIRWPITVTRNEAHNA